MYNLKPVALSNHHIVKRLARHNLQITFNRDLGRIKPKFGGKCGMVVPGATPRGSPLRVMGFIRQDAFCDFIDFST
jgi:hypothetical protein